MNLIVITAGIINAVLLTAAVLLMIEIRIMSAAIKRYVNHVDGHVHHVSLPNAQQMRLKLFGFKLQKFIIGMRGLFRSRERDS